MGLFDAYDRATYQGTPGAQGGLLDRILAAYSATPTPSAGFPTSPMDAQASAPAAAPMAPQPQQASPIDFGGSQMQRFGPASAFSPPPGQLDPATGEHVAPAPAAAPVQQPMQPAAPAPSFLDTARSHLDASAASMDHGGGLIGGLTSLITGQRHDPQAQFQADQAAQQQKQVQQLSAALTGRGIPADQALQLATIHAIDKEAGKALIEKALGPPQAAPQYAWDPKTGKAVHLYEPEQKDNFQVVQTGEDGLGKKTFSKMNKADGTMTPIGAAPGTDNGGGIGDMSLTGPAYLATVPKQQAGIMQGMVDGTIQPPSSFAATKPYWQNMLAGAKNLDPSFDANNWTSRHNMSNQIAASGNSSMGGILSNGKSSFKHLAEYTDSAADLGNASHNYIGGSAAAHTQNYFGNKVFAGSDTSGKIKAINDNLGKYGAESTKFYAGTGGGVEERMNALKEMDPITTSSEEAAAFANKEKNLMLDRLREKESQIRDVMGQAYLQKHPVFTDELKADIARIETNVAKLRGSAPAAAAGGTAPTGVKWSVVQ
jgi:hypothetical protein